MSIFKEFTDDVPLLVEGGLIAIKQGDEESAKKIFNAVGVFDPNNLAKKLGYGLIALHKMDIKSAQKLFQEILDVEKTNWRAQSFLAFSHMLSVLQDKTTEQRKEALQTCMRLSQEVLDNCDIPSTRALAQSLIDWEKELAQAK